jgi:hypothetical protein
VFPLEPLIDPLVSRLVGHICCGARIRCLIPFVGTKI